MAQPTAFLMAAIIIHDNCFESMHTQGLKLIKMPASSNKQKSDSLTVEDISEVLDKDKKHGYSLRNMMSFRLIQMRKIQTVSQIRAVWCMKVNPMKKCRI
jgi:hypothetical protein